MMQAIALTRLVIPPWRGGELGRYFAFDLRIGVE